MLHSAPDNRNPRREVLDEQIAAEPLHSPSATTGVTIPLPVEAHFNRIKPALLTIRLPRAVWAKAWRAMIEVGPVCLIANDPVYIVLPAHLQALTARGLSYKVVSARPVANEALPDIDDRV